MIDAVIANLGFLPTGGTRNAAKLNPKDTLAVTLSGCRVLGDSTVSLDQLEGFSKKLVRFRVNLQEETDITVTVRGQRCGEAKRTVRFSPRS